MNLAVFEVDPDCDNQTITEYRYADTKVKHGLIHPCYTVMLQMHDFLEQQFTECYKHHIRVYCLHNTKNYKYQDTLLYNSCRYTDHYPDDWEIYSHLDFAIAFLRDEIT